MVKFSLPFLEDALDAEEREDFEKYIENLNQVNQEANKTND